MTSKSKGRTAWRKAPVAVIVLCLLAPLRLASAQDRQEVSLDALLASPRRDLWLTVLFEREQPGTLSKFRDQLAKARQAGDPSAIVQAAEELSLALVANRDFTRAAGEEAVAMLQEMMNTAPQDAKAEVRIVLSLVLARVGELSKAIILLKPENQPTSPELHVVEIHLRSMFASWRHEPPNDDFRRLSRNNSGISYPLTIFPEKGDWEIIRAAYLIATYARYGNAWSRLQLDALERTVENQTLQRLSDAEKDREKVWYALVDVFNFYDAHERPSSALPSLTAKLVGDTLTRSQRIQVLQMLARRALRVGDSAEAQRYFLAAQQEIADEYPYPKDRIRPEINLAKALDTPESPTLAITAFEKVDETAKLVDRSGDQLTVRFTTAQELLRLYANRGELRRISEVHDAALPIAELLDSDPSLTAGHRFYREQLELAQIRAISQIPFRRGEAMVQIGDLLMRMNAIAQVWERPADQVLEAIDEAQDPGSAKSIEEHLQRVAASEIQEAAFPILAQLQIYNGEWRKADKTLQQALNTDFKRRAICGSLEQLEYWKDLALVAEALSEPAKADGWLGEWMNCASVANPNSRQSAEALIARGKLLRKTGDWYGAEYLFKRALSILTIQALDGDLSVVSAKLALAGLLTDENRMLEASEYAVQAARALTSASVGAAEWRVLESDSMEVIERLHSPTQDLCAVTFALVQHGSTSQAAAAFQAFAARASLKDPKLAALVQQRLELQRRREIIDVQFQNAFATEAAQRNSNQRATLTSQIQSLAEALTDSGKALEAFPNYADFVSGRTVPLEEFTKARPDGWILDSDEALIVFTQAPAALYANIVSRGRATLLRLDLSESTAKYLVQNIRDTLSITALKSFDFPSATNLYQRVWAPLSPALEGIKRIIVVVTGPLQNLPLEILVERPPAASEKAIWLDDRMSVTYAPSVATLRALRTDVPVSKAIRSIAVFGPPELSGIKAEAKATSSFSDFVPKPMGGGFPCSGTLPEFPPDVSALSRDLATYLKGDDSDVHMGSDMTESQFRTLNRVRPLAEFRVLAFVTHGLMASEFSTTAEAEPALAFTPPANCRSDDPLEDGLLTASEISELSLDADWVLLLACNTGSGEDIIGAEPLSGLARAFLYAGARSLLVSHWSVDATSTAKLIELAFQQGPGVKRADRLRAARGELRSMPRTTGATYDHPAFWGAFVLIGDGR